MTLSLRGLSFGYPGRPLFEDFSLEAGEGDSPLVILGPSGCGKTTLLRLAAALEQPRSGEVLFSWPPRMAAEGVPPVSVVFQESRLLPWLTALENVGLPVRHLLGKAASEERGRRFLELAGLGDRGGSYPGELSGGQRQRVAIARAFACPSPLVLMDEPFQSLDIPLRVGLMDLTRSLLAPEERFLVAVTHDPRDAVYLGRRIILLGAAPRGIVLDERVDLPPEARRYAAPSAVEDRLMEALGAAV